MSIDRLFTYAAYRCTRTRGTHSHSHLCTQTTVEILYLVILMAIPLYKQPQLLQVTLLITLTYSSFTISNTPTHRTPTPYLSDKYGGRVQEAPLYGLVAQINEPVSSVVGVAWRAVAIRIRLNGGISCSLRVLALEWRLSFLFCLSFVCMFGW